MPRPLPRQKQHAVGRLLRLIDRVAAEINPYLFVLAIGLAALYLSCLFMLLSTTGLTRLHPPAMAATPAGVR